MKNATGHKCRNLTDAQAWQLVKEIGELLKAKGKENLKKSPGRGKKGSSTVDEPIDTQQELADKLDWSEGKDRNYNE